MTPETIMTMGSRAMEVSLVLGAPLLLGPAASWAFDLDGLMAQLAASKGGDARFTEQQIGRASCRERVLTDV